MKSSIIVKGKAQNNIWKQIQRVIPRNRRIKDYVKEIDYGAKKGAQVKETKQLRTICPPFTMQACIVQA